jgi:hypothetical protein
MRFVKYVDDTHVHFRCPGCKSYHVLPIVGPKAWAFNGNYDRPTLYPSILAREFEGDKVVRVCHSFVTDGRIQFLGDSTHDMKNQTVDLTDL